VLRVELANTRDAPARQQTLSIVHALMKQAARGARLDDHWTFHPLDGPLPEHVSQGQSYPLEIVFPAAPAARVEAFAAALMERTENFRVRPLAPVLQRSLADLWDEQAGGTARLFPAAGEICLDFDVPFPFETNRKHRIHRFTAHELLHSMVRRVETAFGVQLPGWEDLAGCVRTLPWFWEPAAVKKPAGKKSIWLTGAAGPLYLKGDIEPWAELLLLCSELHAAQRRSRIGAARYRLARRRAFFDGPSPSHAPAPAGNLGPCVTAPHPPEDALAHRLAPMASRVFANGAAALAGSDRELLHHLCAMRRAEHDRLLVLDGLALSPRIPRRKALAELERNLPAADGPWRRALASRLAARAQDGLDADPDQLPASAPLLAPLALLALGGLTECCARLGLPAVALEAGVAALAAGPDEAEALLMAWRRAARSLVRLETADPWPETAAATRLLPPALDETPERPLRETLTSLRGDMAVSAPVAHLDLCGQGVAVLAEGRVLAARSLWRLGTLSIRPDTTLGARLALRLQEQGVQLRELSEGQGDCGESLH
jgi:hypothetical protein